MGVTAFIPVRGGSKSIPLKNIKLFCGKPLIFWNILALNNLDLVEEIIVATDSDEIEQCVKGFHFNKVKIYRRLSQNATDESSTESVMLEYLYIANLPIERVFVLVQATSPFTKKEDFENGIKFVMNDRFDSCLSCVPFKRFLWNKKGLSINYDFNQRPRRQNFDGSLMENGAFYVSTVGAIISSNNRLSGRIGVYEMPEYTGTEIDEPIDWIIAENIMKKYVLKDVEYPKANIKIFISDVDGVLTDAGMYYSEFGDELKKFNTHDGMAFNILRDHNIKTGIITSEETHIVERRAKKLKLDYIYQGKKHGGKLAAALEICSIENISLDEVAYIGDDINCSELLSSVGYAACPADAVQEIKNIDGILILKNKGGEGAVREFVDLLLNK